ncbi:MAG: hypothetical protein ABIG93_02225 [archaeon]|nr:hypothetical protein [Nanoarchaeota archaeon]
MNLKLYEIVHGSDSQRAVGHIKKHTLLKRERITGLADGQGDYGNIASDLAVKAVNEMMGLIEPSNYQDGLLPIFYQRLYLNLNSRLADSEEGKNLETGLLVTLIDDLGNLYYSKISDSKLYLYRNGELSELNVSGGSTLKSNADIPMYIVESKELAKEDLVLLCSGNVYKKVGEKVIHDKLKQLFVGNPVPNSESLTDYASKLCKQVLDSGEEGEVTVLLSYLVSEKHFIDIDDLGSMSMEMEEATIVDYGKLRSLKRELRTVNEQRDFLSETAIKAREKLDQALETISEYESRRHPKVQEMLNRVKELEDELGAYRNASAGNPEVVKLGAQVGALRQQVKGYEKQQQGSAETSYETNVVLQEVFDGKVGELQAEIENRDGKIRDLISRLRAHDAVTDEEFNKIIVDYGGEGASSYQDKIDNLNKIIDELNVTINREENDRKFFSQEVEQLELKVKEYESEKESSTEENNNLIQQLVSVKKERRGIRKKLYLREIKDSKWSKRAIAGICSLSTAIGIAGAVAYYNYAPLLSGHELEEQEPIVQFPSVAEYAKAMDDLKRQELKDEINCEELVQGAENINQNFTNIGGSVEEFNFLSEDMDAFVKRRCQRTHP